MTALPVWSVTSTARVSLRDGRLTWSSAPPVVLRRTGPRQLHVVAVGGGPLGGDHLRLDLDLGPGERLAVASAAATVVQPGRVPDDEASFAVVARLAEGAALDWRPEPTVVCDGADWFPTMQVEAAEGARAQVVEQLVLGRSGQRGGRCASTLRATYAGRTLLATTTMLDGADPALSGIGGTGGARSSGSVLVVGADAAVPDEAGADEDDVAWACSDLDGPATLLTAVGTVRGVGRVLARGGQRSVA